MSADQNTAYVIVEETVQRVYHLDPENPEHVEFFDRMRVGVITEERFVAPAPVLGKRSKKGAPVVDAPKSVAMLEERTVLTGVTLLNRADGEPIHETKWTNTTVTSKPIRSKPIKT